MKTVVGTFSDLSRARRAIDLLLDNSFLAGELTLVSPEGPTSTHVVPRLEALGIPRGFAERYAKVLGHGEHLVVVHCDADRADRAQTMLQQGGRTHVTEHRGPIGTRPTIGTPIATRPDAISQEFASAAAPPSGVPETPQVTRVEAEDAWTGGQIWRGEESRWRDHFDRCLADGSVQWEEVQPAYNLGWDLAQQRRNLNADWYLVESEARERWDLHYDPHMWAHASPAIRYAFEHEQERMQRHPQV